MTLFSVEDVPLSGVSVVDGSFVSYVLIPPTAPRSRNDIGMALQFAKVYSPTRLSFLTSGTRGST
jgi:hypothetical protein